MISAAPVLTQLFLSCAALVGLFILQSVLARRDPRDPINRRFLFGIRVTIVLFLGRVLTTVSGIEAFRILVLAAAALVPLAVLLLAEGLLRRHAPLAFKALIGIGAAGFTLTSLWYSDSIDPARLVGLSVFQVMGFVVSGWMIVTRDKGSLTASENKMAVRLGLSLILLIPLAIGDFFLFRIGLPVQLSALGVLILCWLAIGLGRPHQGHRATFLGFAVMCAAGAFAGSVTGFFAGLDRDGYVLAVALVMATLFLVAVFQDARALLMEERSLGLLRHLATAETDDAMTFLRELQDHPAVEGAVVIEAAALDALQPDVLARIFGAAPVLRKADPPQIGTAEDEHIAYLFERFVATHIMIVQNDPFVLVALSMPSLGASPSAELELQVVQRMATLIAGNAGGRHG